MGSRSIFRHFCTVVWRDTARKRAAAMECRCLAYVGGSSWKIRKTVGAIPQRRGVRTADPQGKARRVGRAGKKSVVTCPPKRAKTVRNPYRKPTQVDSCVNAAR